MRRDLPSENDVRNAIGCVTVSATRIEIVLNESIVCEGQDRVLTLPWTRVSSRRRREIIQGVGEAQRPLRAMRTKARDGFIRALGDARRWLDELLIDPAQTIESLAMREDKSERSIRMTMSLAFISPILAEAALEGLPSTRVQRQAPDRPASSLVRAMARSGTARADSGSGRTRLIHAVFDSLLTYVGRPPFRSNRFHRAARETEFFGQRLAGDIGRRPRENDRNSVRRRATAR
jgi:hypothetical protein